MHPYPQLHAYIPSRRRCSCRSLRRHPRHHLWCRYPLQRSCSVICGGPAVPAPVAVLSSVFFSGKWYVFDYFLILKTVIFGALLDLKTVIFSALLASNTKCFCFFWEWLPSKITHQLIFGLYNNCTTNNFFCKWLHSKITRFGIFLIYNNHFFLIRLKHPSYENNNQCFS